MSTGLRGAWRLLRVDTGGLAEFDESVDGFWKSFYAAVLTAPAYVIVVAIHLADVEPAGGFLHLVLVESGAYVIEWVAYPLVVFYVAEMLDKQETYIRFIVALNWSRVIQMILYLPVLLLVEAGAFGPLGGLLTFMVSIAVLLYQWYVTRTALDVQGMAAGLLVALDLTISIVIVQVVNSMVVA
ncbi:MAG: hypothetical protein ACFCUQ_11190 [Kiloniellales bacterium]